MKYQLSHRLAKFQGKLTPEGPNCAQIVPKEGVPMSRYFVVCSSPGCLGELKRKCDGEACDSLTLKTLLREVYDRQTPWRHSSLAELKVNRCIRSHASTVRYFDLVSFHIKDLLGI